MEQNSRKNYIRAISFFSVLSVLLAVSTVVYMVKNQRLTYNQRVINEKAVNSLCESLDSINVSLQKSVYTLDSEALSKIGNDLCREGVTAKESLAFFSPEGEMSEEIYKFLSQVGQFTLYLAQQSNDKVDSASVKSLQALYEYSKKLSEGMNEISLDYLDGNVTFDKAIGNLNLDDVALPDEFYKRLSDVEQTLGDYPTLIYDGPFADTLSNRQSELLRNKSEITKNEAQQKAAKLLGTEAEKLRQEADVNSNIDLYCFSLGEVSLGITKKGGYLCYLLSDTYALEGTISPEEAIKRGEKYLENLGYKNMKSSYYTCYDGVCTINYAYSENDVIFYGDLIKVGIALDTGRLLSLDGETYLLNHRERELSKVNVSAKKARENLPQSLTLLNQGLAVIPLESGKEAFCYELHCKDKNGQELLIYIDVTTGKQQDLLLLLKSDGGTLTK